MSDGGAESFTKVPVYMTPVFVSNLLNAQVLYMAESPLSQMTPTFPLCTRDTETKEGRGRKVQGEHAIFFITSELKVKIG